MTAAAVTPNSTIAPTGAGFAIRPTTVATKMARSRHASGVTSAGRGAIRTATPAKATTAVRMTTPPAVPPDGRPLAISGSGISCRRLQREGPAAPG